MKRDSVRHTCAIALLTLGMALAVMIPWTSPRLQGGVPPAQPQAKGVSVGAEDIGGAVTSPKGPEAGVWVIAETTGLPTKFRKIVVTDDAGRYLLPELPQATYKVWVRGYGLVDSRPAEATPGKTLALTAVIAPNSRAAAQYYPADYWFSLLKIPPKSAFPSKNPDIPSQAQFLFYLKRRCTYCHQVGNKATREIEPGLGTFDSPALAWQRRLMSGQEGGDMIREVNRFGHDRGLAMFADWSSRIAAGELPPAPPRPQGVERNVVITLWEIDTDKSFIHDVIGTNDWNTSANAYGPLYTLDWMSAEIWALNPKDNTVAKLASNPFRDESERKLMPPHDPQTVSTPSPYWGSDLDRSQPHRHAAYG